MFTKRQGTIGKDLIDNETVRGLFNRRARAKQQRASRRRPFMVGLLAGAAGMFILDPRTGRRRRALVRDKVVHFGHVVDDVVTETVPKKLHYMSGFAQGLTHRPSSAGHEGDDDGTITDRVMSTVFRDLDIQSGQVNVNTVDHVVYLRGTLADQRAVEQIERRARKVPGVVDIVNLINRPDVDPSTMHPGRNATAG